MAYTKSTRQLDLRDLALTHDAIGPGLYPDEVLIDLDTGEEIAVSVKSERLPNSGDAVIIGWARWIETDGSTRLDNAGNEMEGEYRHTFPALQVDSVGLNALATGVLLVMLGEPSGLPEVDPSDDVRAAASIRRAIATANLAQTMGAAADLL